MNIVCKNCGHQLGLPYGALATRIERGYSCDIWCVKCGRLSTISSTGVTLNGTRVNRALVKRYKDWEVENQFKKNKEDANEY